MSLNHIRPWKNIYRRKSRQIMVGNVPVGGDAPIAVQTMTNTLTTDIAGTIAQVQAATDAGADIVRVSVPDQASSHALKEIVRESPVPIVADIHFHYKRGIESAEAGAACLRINPGNIGEKYRPQLLPRKISSMTGRGPDVNRMSLIEPHSNFSIPVQGVPR